MQKFAKSKPASDVALIEAPPSGYRGRFAPSPTGLLHFGSLVTALASYLDARANQGIWLLRIEDLDHGREQPGATAAILNSLQAHGLHWDPPLTCQSTRHDLYRAAIAQLTRSGHLYACPCSRKDLLESNGQHTAACLALRSQSQKPSPEGPQADSPTQTTKLLAEGAYALRFALDKAAPKGALTGHWFDRIQGEQAFQLHPGRDDFVVLRRDGDFAYHLAVVVDDIAQGITHVVRGSDLMTATPLQQQLYRALQYPLPHALPHALPQYAHIPLVVNAQGQKLSKQNLAPALDNQRAGENLLCALSFLNQPIADALPGADPASILQWAIAHWQPAMVRGV